MVNLEKYSETRSSDIPTSSIVNVNVSKREEDNVDKVTGVDNAATILESSPEIIKNRNSEPNPR